MNSAGYLPILPLVITPFPLFITPFSAVYHPSLSGGRGATDAGAAAAKRGVGTGARGGGLKGTDPSHTYVSMLTTWLYYPLTWTWHVRYCLTRTGVL